MQILHERLETDNTFEYDRLVNDLPTECERATSLGSSVQNHPGRRVWRFQRGSGGGQTQDDSRPPEYETGHFLKGLCHEMNIFLEDYNNK
jgi:hypothetical protein